MAGSSANTALEPFEQLEPFQGASEAGPGLSMFGVGFVDQVFVRDFYDTYRTCLV